MVTQADSATFFEGDEWGQVLRAYARPGVASACLLLQEELGVDVVVLLHLAYVQEVRGAVVTEDAVARADAAVKPWRDAVVRPLRGARRAIGKDAEALKPLRAGIQKMELLAERQAFALLAAAPACKQTPGAAAPANAVQQVAAFYATAAGAADRLGRADVRQAIACLSKGLFG